jgi:arabinogalactan oligomer/maltooligosaccharide transport system substrate-binding protein
MNNICPNCGNSNPLDQEYCASCNASLTRFPRVMRQAWEAARLRKTLGGSGMWSILWGIMGVITGIVLLEASGLNIVLIGIGLFLIGTGIAAWAVPNPITLRLDAAALLIVGLWNIVVTIANGESSQFAWAIAGIIQIVWSIQRFRKHGDFVRVQHVPKAFAKEVEMLVNGTQRAKVDREEGAIAFRANNKLWKARLMPDLVVAVAGAGNAQDVRFVLPDRFDLQVTAEAKGNRWAPATIKLGYDSWTGTVSQVSVAHYGTWRAAGDAGSAEPIPVEQVPVADVSSTAAPTSDVTPVSAPVTSAPADAAPRPGWLKWVVVGMAAALLLCAVAGFFAYRALGRREFARAEAAYESGDFEEASESLSRVVNTYRYTGAPYVGEARAYWQECETIDRAGNLRQEGKYGEAAKDHRAYLANSPEGPFVAYVRAGLQDTYVEWSEALVEEGKYVNALVVLDDAYTFYEDEPVPAAIETAFEAVLLGLASDDGEDGKNAIGASWVAICEGGAATSQAVGLLSATSAKVWYRGPKLALPTEMVATQPGHFRYAICLEEELDTVQPCRYMPVGVVNRQRVEWRVVIRDTLTGKPIESRTFKGGEPDKCPKTWTFVGKKLTGTLKGTNPDNTTIVEWIASVTRAQLLAGRVEIEPSRPKSEGEAGPEPTPSTKQIELSIWYNWLNEDGKALEELLVEYRDLHPNVTFVVGQTNEREKVETVLAAGYPHVDVILWSGLEIPGWAENGYIVPLSEYADAAWAREQYIDAAAETVIHKGKVYGLPVCATTMALLYNRALLSEEDVPRTTDDLFEQARAWTETTAYFVYEPWIYFFSAGWFHGGEAWFLNRDCVPNLDVPDGVAAAELIAAFREIMPENVNYGMADQMFLEGEIPITLNGSWALSTMEKDGIDYGVALFPAISATGNDPAPYVSPVVWVVTNQAKTRGVVEAAWDLIQFLASAESQRYLAQERHMVPTVRAAAEEGWFGDQEGLAVFYAQAERGVPMPPNTCSTIVWDELSDMLVKIWKGTDPAQAVADTQKILEETVQDQE